MRGSAHQPGRGRSMRKSKAGMCRKCVNVCINWYASEVLENNRDKTRKIK